MEALTRGTTFDVEAVRRDFPGLTQEVHGKPLAYLDNAASSQTPRQVVEALTEGYLRNRANVHRGVHQLAERATDAFEGARLRIQRLLNAPEDKEVIFTRGTTEAMNLVAQTFGRQRLGAGDEVLITTLEHHANIVPWQLLAEQTGCVLRVVPVSDAGEVTVEAVVEAITPRTKLLSCVHVSNALGTIVPLSEIVEAAHAREIPVVVDGAQAVPHLQVDVQALGCDFYAFSGHKLFGPTGIGALWGKREHLEAMPPYQGGGEMIQRVTFEKTTFNQIPWKFEAGTPHIVGAAGLGAAIDYWLGLDHEAVSVYERELLQYATDVLLEVEGLRILGPQGLEDKVSVVSFVVEGIHPHDLATILDREGVATRAGNHCTQPLMQRLGVPATTRASLAFYNTRGEVDQLVAALRTAQEIFG